MKPDKDSVYSVLERVEDPERRKDIVSLGYVTEVEASEASVRVKLTLPAPPTPLKKEVRTDCEKALSAAFPDVGDIDVELGFHAGDAGTSAAGDEANRGGAAQADAHASGGRERGTPGGGPAGHGPKRPGAGGMMNAETPDSLKNVKYTIAVASGKGGVGKSTVAVNLAAALAAGGARVGILDADVYGPSLPIMLHVNEQPRVNQDEQIVPLTAHGMSVMSIGFLADENAPFIWRGPMASGAIGQFIKEVEWGELDYLVFDLPPGTGDVQLTLVQTLPISGALIVTTPQNLALADANRAQQMFNKVNVPIAGLVENMSYYVCPNCGHREDIFDTGGGERSAANLGVPFLGAIPLYPGIRQWGDSGTPFVLAERQSEQAAAIVAIATAIREHMPL
ncbi:MAG: Mrp/NBP35 family ATP-binding protein [Spirochaetales bacterium]